MAIMHVVILCGGKGTRLAPLTDHCPKSLIDTKGTPFIHRQLDRWIEFGALRFSLLVGHYWEQIVSAVGTEWRGVPVEYSLCPRPGLWPALATFEPRYREFLLTYGDVYPAQKPPPFGPHHLASIGYAGDVDIGAIWVRSDVCRIRPLSPDLNDLWRGLAELGAVDNYKSLPVHEIGSHEGLAKFNASL